MEASASPNQDLSTLAWVRDELGKSLETAHKALRRCLKEASHVAGSDIDDIDPAILRTARLLFHQGVGALELVALPAGATVLRACEAAVQRIAAKPHKLEPAMVETIERASFALIDYVGRLLADKPVSSVALFPQYRAVQELAGADRAHPADLWNLEWQWRPLPAPDVPPLPDDVDPVRVFEAGLLSLMRKPQGEVAMRLAALCGGLGARQDTPEETTLWRLASAFFEGMARGSIPVEVYTKRAASSLLSHLRARARGETEVPQRLAQDLLFFCAHAIDDGRHPMPSTLAHVRQAWHVENTPPVNYLEHQLGRYDPAWVVQARKRVSAAKDSWSAVAGGDMHRLSGLNEQFALVGDSLQRLYPGGDWLANSLQQGIGATAASGAAPQPTLAMEVATSLLYLEASLEDADFDHPEQGDRIRRLASRIDAVHRGQPPEPLEPWMEELYRRVSERQTLGSVVQELRSSLSEAERQIDLFFRTPNDTTPLVSVPQVLQSMRGVLTVLGVEHGAQTVVRMRDDVDALILPREGVTDAPDPGTRAVFERLARNLGALGFLIDMLAVQPQLAKSLFVWDAASGLLNPVMGRVEPPAPPAPSLPVEAPRLIEEAHALGDAVQHDVPLEVVSSRLDQLAHEPLVAKSPDLAQSVAFAQTAVEQAQMAGPASDVAEWAAREEVAQAMADFVATASGPLAPEPVPLTLTNPVPPTTASGLEDDDEMLEIFLEEAREVVSQAQESLAELEVSPADAEALTVVRRSFHTLKGSARMVGLNDFGEASWSCEQLYNAWLADNKPASPELCEFTGQALSYLGAWVDEIAQRSPVSHISAPVSAAANALRLEGEWIGVTGSPATIAGRSAEVEAPKLPDMPDTPEAPAMWEATEVLPVIDSPQAPAPEEVGTLDFALDLAALDGPSPAAAPEPEASRPGAFAAPDFGAAHSALTGHQPPPSVLGALEGVDLDLPATASAPLTAEPLFETLLPSPPSEADIELPFDVDVPEAVAEEEMLPDLDEAPEALVAEPDAVLPDAVLPDVAPASDGMKVIGPLRISESLFDIYLNEAEERSSALSALLAQWSADPDQPLPDDTVVLAHSLAGSSATVGYAELSALARALEHALARTQALGSATVDDASLYTDTADEIRRLLHQFAAGLLKSPSPDLLERLAAHDTDMTDRLEAHSSMDAPPSDALPLIDLPGPESEFMPPEEVSDDSVRVPLDAAAEAEEPLPPQPEPAPVEPRVEPPVVTEAEADPEEAVPSGFAATHFSSPLTDLAPATLAPLADRVAPPSTATPASSGPTLDDDIDAVDAVDPDLFPIFEEEGQDLLGTLSQQMRTLADRPNDLGAAQGCLRTLHTLKGGARLAGAMRLGEMAHRMETALERGTGQGDALDATHLQQLQAQLDGLTAVFEALRKRDAQAYAQAEIAARDAVAAVAAATPPSQRPPMPSFEVPEVPRFVAGDFTPSQPIPLVEPVAATAADGIDWSRFMERDLDTPRADAALPGTGLTAVRVRPQLLDRLVNTAGEVAITRARFGADLTQIRASLNDLGDNMERLRTQLRDMELQAETQMTSRMEAARAASAEFDPLEFDRFTRFQELSRMIAESVNDVATVQRALQRSVESSEDALAAQARLTRELQDDLLRTRMVEFESLSDRLYRVVRLAAKETGKQVRLDITGGQIEIDRSVLDRMTGAFEHLLRNCVAHGIESPESRLRLGKDAAGSILIHVHQEGNEVSVEVRDDGAGLDLPRIRARAETLGLLSPGQMTSDAELAQFIFAPGFTTVERVTELSGRGVGMDVVRSEVNAIGGRIETATTAGRGTSFKLVLPLTTAVTQVVMLRCGQNAVAVPANLIEIVRRASLDEVDLAYRTGSYHYGDQVVPFFWLGALLQSSGRGTEQLGRSLPVVIVRSAQQRVALHVDEVLGHQEVVVKNLGPQLSRLPGLAGMTLLVSGAVALIYNPVALATVYGEAARRYMAASPEAAGQATAAATTTEATLGAPALPRPEDLLPVQVAPLVLVVDDSLTVRRVTQRLLAREGYRVALAKDGLDALEKLSLERPSIVLSDIEMPRMDGFDLLRNIRADERWHDLPVVMITSRIAQKHRDYAQQLGANHYLGKPYSEDELLSLIRSHTQMENPDDVAEARLGHA